ncbi:MAG: nusG [Pedosphaera sp.]|nr:nusG [Pedosphaera sp.]
MQTNDLAWYCARTKPKHEHIAAANVRKLLGLEVFNPQLQVERSTRRCIVRVVEPLFPCYIFVRCRIEEKLSEIRYANGVSTMVHFGDKIPAVSDSVIQDLQSCFKAEAPVVVHDGLQPGVEVILTDGAFVGMQASVLRVLPARDRIQVLFDILGHTATVEVARRSITLEKNSMAYLLPFLAAPHPEMVRV